MQGRNWLPKTGWASSKAAFYFAKNWVGNCPPCPPASYAPVMVDDLFDLSLRSPWSVGKLGKGPFI